MDADNPRENLRKRRRESFRKLAELAEFSRSKEADERLDVLLDEFFEVGCELRDRNKYLGK